METTPTVSITSFICLYEDCNTANNNNTSIQVEKLTFFELNSNSFYGKKTG